MTAYLNRYTDAEIEEAALYGYWVTTEEDDCFDPGYSFINTYEDSFFKGEDGQWYIDNRWGDLNPQVDGIFVTRFDADMIDDCILSINEAFYALIDEGSSCDAVDAVERLLVKYGFDSVSSTVRFIIDMIDDEHADIRSAVLELI